MKKSGTKTVFTPHIINASGNVSWVIRIRDWGLILFLWAVYAYLLRDCVVFFGDVYHWLHDGIGAARAYPKLRIFEMLQDYSISLAVMAGIFISWALYNRIRFAGKKRRKAVTPVTSEDLGKMFGLDTKDLEVWQETRSLSVHLDDKGRISQIDIAR